MRFHRFHIFLAAILCGVLANPAHAAAPTLTGIETSPLLYRDTDPLPAITSAVSVVDTDSATLASARVQISGNYQNGLDVLNYVQVGGIAGTFDATTGTLTLSGADTLANYQLALRAVAFHNNSVKPDTASRTVSFTVNDGTADSNTATRSITVTAGWTEDFESYASGDDLHQLTAQGKSRWHGWDNNAGATAFVRSAPAPIHGGSNVVEISGSSDLVHEYSGCDAATSNGWVYTAWQFIPSGFNGTTYFILLNTYQNNGTKNWSVQVSFNGDGTGGHLHSDFDGAELPLITGSWVPIRVEIDYVHDVQTFLYNGTVLYQKSWKDGILGGGVPNLAAVDLYAQNSTPIYYDDISLRRLPIVTWATPADITYGTPLGASQLNAGADVAGNFTYTPASGTILPFGAAQTLKADFAPTDSDNYVPPRSTSTTINVARRALTVSATGVNRVYNGTATATVTLTDDRVGADQITVTYTSATFADKDVAAGKTVSVTGIAISGADANNYTVNTSASTTADITAFPLTVSGVTASDKTYDATTAANIDASGAALVGVFAVDAGAVNLDGTATATGAYSSVNVIASAPVAISGLSLSGAQAFNYTLTAPSVLAGITRRPLTVTAQSDTRFYNGARASAPIPAITTGTLAGSDTAAFTQSFDTKSAGSGKTLTPTGSVVDGNSGGNYALTFVNSTAGTINPLALTASGVTANDKTYDRTTAATLNLLAATLPGAIAGDDVSLSGTTGTFASKNAGSGIAVTATGVTLSGADAANYTLTVPAMTASIATLTLTVQGLTAASKIYDRTTAATLDASAAALFTVITGDTVTLDATGASGTFADAQVASGKTVTVAGLALSGADKNNYALTQPTASANIIALTLTVKGLTANNKVFDGTTAATLNTTSAALVGVIAGDTVTLDTTSASGTFNDAQAGTGKPVTVSGLALSGADRANYALTQPTLSATITAAPPVVLSPPSGSVTSGIVNQPVTFSWPVQDSTPITYTWNFGDGTVVTSTSSSVVHTFTSPSVFTVTVTATNGTGQSVNGTVTFTVAAAATPPGTPTSICDGLNPLIFKAQQISAKLAFPSSLHRDSLTVKGIVQLPDGFKPAGQVVNFEIGKLTGTATLDAKGGSKSGGLQIALKFKAPKKGTAFTARPATLSIVLKNQSMSGLTLGNIPVLNVNSSKKGDPATLSVCVVLTGTQAYMADNLAGIYKAKLNKSATFTAKFH